MRRQPLDPRGFLLFLIGILGSATLAFSQGVEMEPNNDCASAQDFGSVTVPFTVSGSLNTPPGTPDVDFFKITGTPGASVRLGLEGADTARGTLGDPFLGILDSSCNFIAFDDDGGAGRNSQLSVTFPADGILIVAATSFYDNDFTGDGLSSGSYTLILSAASFAGSISGREEEMGSNLYS